MGSWRLGFMRAFLVAVACCACASRRAGGRLARDQGSLERRRRSRLRQIRRRHRRHNCSSSKAACAIPPILIAAATSISSISTSTAPSCLLCAAIMRGRTACLRLHRRRQRRGRRSALHPHLEQADLTARHRRPRTGIDGPSAIRAMLDTVFSGTYRSDAGEKRGVLSDFYSPALQPGSIHPGSIVYDVNGHVGSSGRSMPTAASTTWTHTPTTRSRAASTARSSGRARFGSAAASRTGARSS